ncbi:MAG TPA: hypothetical protein VMW74_08850 [Nitrosopumilaceae archaeon]|nr:hypothetical protein [Nitrosopumilaceae archaeon]
MKTKTLGLFAIPIFAAIMISGSIAPVAYADHENNAECDAINEQLIIAFNSGNEKRFQAVLNAFLAACTGVGGEECNAFQENFERAYDRGDIDSAVQQFEQLKAHDCFA